MVVDKENTKTGGGRYVGGFFQLFDWKAKSRKKLFSSKSEFSERSKQGKKSDGNLPMTRLNLVDDDETGVALSVKGGSDYSCASSVTDDDGYGARPPGVVARLMGLDSLPVTNNSEPYSSPLSYTQSLHDAPIRRRNVDYHDHDLVYSGNLLNKVEAHQVRNFEELKPQRIVSRPIEKFQTEVLPPKSAKSIPLTHHKLLSPIKSPGFIPSKNAAHIMEAAAKYIEPGHHAPPKPRMPSVGSSSGPLKIRYPKEKAEQKMPPFGSSSIPLKVREQTEKVEITTHRTYKPAEAYQRPVESNAAKYLKGQSLNKSWNGSADTSLRQPDIEEVSSALKNRNKSVSLAIQAKVNVQKREGLTSSSGQTSSGIKEQQAEARSSQVFKSQPNFQKKLSKKPSAHNGSSALRPNSQKQNSTIDRNKLPSKTSGSGIQGRKMTSGDSSLGKNKTAIKVSGNSRTGTRKLDLATTDGDKDVSYSDTKNFPRKKRLINGEFHFEKTQAVNSLFTVNNNKKTVQTQPLNDRHFTWAEESKMKGSDVVSFTFTAPLSRSTPASKTLSQLERKHNNPCMDNRGKRLLLDTDNMQLSSVGYNVMGGDGLSMLLEQKLRELSYAVENSQRDNVKARSTSNFSSVIPNSTPAAFGITNHTHQLTDKLDSPCESEFSSADPSALSWRDNFQGADEMDECSSNRTDTRKLHLDCRQPSPVSILEPSVFTESCNSSDSTYSSSNAEESKHCSSFQAQEILGCSPVKKFHPLEADIDLSDSASSVSAVTVSKKNAESTEWELEYVKHILYNVESMSEDFALGETHNVVNSQLFDQLESRKVVGSGSRLTRKLLFDCVSECFDIRCTSYAGGGCVTFAGGVPVLRRKDRLAEEVCRLISGWKGMSDSLVDEFVDKDMSCQRGRWLDFEVDGFEIGVEIQCQMLDSLVDEVVADFLKC